MSELADETDSKSVVFTGVWVRVPLPAPTEVLSDTPVLLRAFMFVICCLRDITVIIYTD